MSFKRKKMSRGSSRSKFRKGSKVHGKNRKRVMRGGYRI